MKRYKIVLAMAVILGSVNARSIPVPRRSEVRFASDGIVRTLQEVLRADVTVERLTERTVFIRQIDSKTRFVTIDGRDRTDLEVWTLKKQIGWQVTWTDALIEHKDTFADQAPDFAGIVPELVQIGPRDFAIGVLTIRRTGYSGGGGSNTFCPCIGCVNLERFCAIRWSPRAKPFVPVFLKRITTRADHAVTSTTPRAR
jgi:hypothetical protein